MKIITFFYNLLWGDLVTIPLSDGSSIGLSLLVMILIPAGIFFTIRTKFLPFRCFSEMLRVSIEKRTDGEKDALSGFQTLIISTATRVGMGNLVGVVAAISAGGAGAIFWMWVTALMGSSTAFVESTLGQLYKEPDPLYGGYRGGPAYYIHNFFTKGKEKRWHLLSVLFAVSALLCWAGVSQVISNSVSSSLYNAFDIMPIVSTTILTILAAIIILKKNASVKVLDLLVPAMAVFYFLVSVFIIIKNIPLLPSVFVRIFEEAFGLRPLVAGGFGAALMNGVKRGLFSNEAGSGSASCVSSASNVSHPAKAGFFQAFGVFIDTIVLCTCTAMIILLAPAEVLDGLSGMALLQTAMNHHFGKAGVIFTAVALCLFSFSTFIGILYYARSNVAYLFGNSWKAQNAYKFLALAMLFAGGLASQSFVWDLGDIGLGLMTIFNIMAIIPMSGQAIKCLNEYLELKKSGK